MAVDDKAKLLGSALLIVTPGSPMIGCLFTSVGFGKRKSSRETIISATSTAFRDLCAQLLGLVPEGQQAQRREFWMPQINSGLFDVPWQLTEAKLKAMGPEEVCHISKLVVFTYPTPP